MPSASQDSSPPSAPLADEALMLQLAEGDEAALRELIRRWQTALLNFFYRSVNDHALAEELTQTVFIRLYRAAPRYRATAKFSTYLFHIARRLLINAVQKAARRPATPTAPEELDAIDGSATDRRLAELEEIFRVALPNLPENQRTAILLLKQQQLSYAEIATIMRASESAVKTWIFRARQTLKQSLDAEV